MRDQHIKINKDTVRIKFNFYLYKVISKLINVFAICATTYIFSYICYIQGYNWMVSKYDKIATIEINVQLLMLMLLLILLILGIVKYFVLIVIVKQREKLKILDKKNIKRT